MTMILKHYGTSYQSVESNFNSRALNEIGFRRDRVFSIPAEEFDASYEKVGEEILTAESDGDVHDEAEAALLDSLKEKLDGLLGGLEEGSVLVVESREGEDYPKTKDKKKNIVVEGENRLYFHWWIDPPLRLGIYRKTGS